MLRWNLLLSLLLLCSCNAPVAVQETLVSSPEHDGHSPLRVRWETVLSTSQTLVLQMRVEAIVEVPFALSGTLRVPAELRLLEGLRTFSVGPLQRGAVVLQRFAFARQNAVTEPIVCVLDGHNAVMGVHAELPYRFVPEQVPVLPMGEPLRVQGVDLGRSVVVSP